MNILTTALMSLSIALAPMPDNPFEGVTVSAGGISLEYGADGFVSRPASSADFEFRLSTTSGKVLKVSL